jgi:hypothetical protein
MNEQVTGGIFLAFCKKENCSRNATNDEEKANQVERVERKKICKFISHFYKFSPLTS